MRPQKTPHFYSVAVGRVPGIYSSWEDCKPQVIGYKRASYRRFKTRPEAENFLDDNRPGGGPANINTVQGPVLDRTFTVRDTHNDSLVQTESSLLNEDVETGGSEIPTRADTPIFHLPSVDSLEGSGYYCVVIGRQPGIYMSWQCCKKQIHRYHGAVFKRLSTYPAALRYLHEVNLGHNSNGLVAGDCSGTRSPVGMDDSEPTIIPPSPPYTRTGSRAPNTPVTCRNVPFSPSQPSIQITSTPRMSAIRKPLGEGSLHKGAPVKRRHPSGDLPECKRTRTCAGPSMSSSALKRVDILEQSYNCPTVSSFMSFNGCK